MNSTLMHESSKPRSKSRPGSTARSTNVVANSPDNACGRLPPNPARSAASTMMSERTAEGAPPVSITYAPIKKATTSVRAPLDTPAFTRTASASDETSAKWLPDTATRCDNPDAEKKSAASEALSSAASPHTVPAIRARSSDEAGSMASTRSARNASKGSAVSVASLAYTSRASATCPFMNRPRAQSSSPSSSMRNTPSISVPRGYRLSSCSRTRATRTPSRSTSASAAKP